MKSNSHTIPVAVRSAWLEPLGTRDIRAIDGGLSSSRVWRLSTSVGSVCLKAWPKATTSYERLAEIHRQLRMLTDAGLDFIPRVLPETGGENWMDAEGYFWEVTDWMPGEPDLSEDVSRERRQAAAEAIARVHHCWRSKGSEKQISPGLIDRIKKLADARNLSREPSRWTNSTNGSLEDLAHRTRFHISQSADRLLRSLEGLQEPVGVHFVIRDLHAEHILFESNRVTGVIDFGAARVDEPLLDLVRLFGSQSPFHREHRNESLQIYWDETSRLQDAERHLIRPTPVPFEPFGDFERLKHRYNVLDEASTLLSAVQWFRWLCIEQRQFVVPLERLLERWDKLLKRLDTEK